MHWIRQFRENYIRKDGGKGISRKELATMVRNHNTGCSEVLIAILEGGGITHPGIAQRIAKVTGCTAEQYNGMVHKMHRGGWKPEKMRRYSEIRQGPRPVQPMTPGMLPSNARSVVILNRAGVEIGREESMTAAAERAGRHVSFVQRRCDRRLKHSTDEFKETDCTFRFADEWDAMDPQQREADMHIAKCDHQRPEE